MSKETYDLSDFQEWFLFYLLRNVVDAPTSFAQVLPELCESIQEKIYRNELVFTIEDFENELDQLKEYGLITIEKNNSGFDPELNDDYSPDGHYRYYSRLTLKGKHFIRFDLLGHLLDMDYETRQKVLDYLKSTDATLCDRVIDLIESDH